MLGPMRARSLMLVAVTLNGAACKKDSSASEEKTETTSKKERACERFASDTARTALLAGQMLVTALEDEPAAKDRGRGEMKSNAQRMKQDLYDKCMGWPDDVMQCLPPLGIMRDGCDERLAAAMDGATPMPKDVPTGPSAAWTFTLESEPRHLAISPDGTVVAVTGVESDSLVGLRDGAVAWRREGDHGHWLLPVTGPATTWVAAEREQLIAFDPATGTERWTAELPPGPDADDDYPEDNPTIQVVTQTAKGLLLGDSTARFFLVDPSACATGATGCMQPSGALVDEILDSDARLFVDGEGRRYLQEEEQLRVFDSQWAPKFTAGARDTLGDVHVDARGVALLIDEDMVGIDPSRCESDKTFALSEWPQRGTMVWRDGDQCPDCRPAPSGCRSWRVFVKDADLSRPARLTDGAVVLHDDEHTLAVADGAVRWKVGTRGMGPLATDGHRVFGLAHAEAEDDPPFVFEAAGADGTIRWRTPLAVDGEASVYTGDIRIAVESNTLAVSYAQTVLVFALSPA